MESFKWKTVCLSSFIRTLCEPSVMYTDGQGHLPEMFSLFPPANVISADMLSRGKPFPDIYLAAAKTLGPSYPSRPYLTTD